MRIALNRPREQAERLHYPIVLLRGPKWYSAEIEVIGGRVARWSVRTRRISAACSVGSITPATLTATLSCSSNTSSSEPSNRSAHRCAPFAASINCAVMRTRPPALRTEPSSTYRTPSSRPTCFTSIPWPLYVKLELRAMTKSQRMRESAVMISSTMPSAKYSCSGSPLILAKGSTAIDGLSGSGSAGGSAAPTRALRALPSTRKRGRAREGAFRSHPVDPHWPSDVLDLLLAQILKDKGQPVAHVVINRIGDEHPAGISQAFDPRGNVDAVAIEVVALDDHVTEIDADAQLDAAVRADIRVPLRDCLLHRDGTAHRVDDAGKLDQHAVAGGLDDAAVVLGDLRIEELTTQRFEAFERAFLVRPHQPRIPRDFGGEDRGETAGLAHVS